MLVLDHLFVTTCRPDDAARALREQGLFEGPPNHHPGQGTACRRFFFADTYLELLYLTDEAEARGPDIARTRLAERTIGSAPLWSRFGLALRHARELPFSHWPYRPPYLPPGMEISMADTDADLPLVFAMPASPPRTGESPTARTWRFECVRIATHLAGRHAAFEAMQTSGWLAFDAPADRLVLEFANSGRRIVSPGGLPIDLMVPDS